LPGRPFIFHHVTFSPRSLATEPFGLPPLSRMGTSRTRFVASAQFRMSCHAKMGTPEMVVTGAGRMWCCRHLFTVATATPRLWAMSSIPRSCEGLIGVSLTYPRVLIWICPSPTHCESVHYPSKCWANTAVLDTLCATIYRGRASCEGISGVNRGLGRGPISSPTCGRILWISWLTFGRVPVVIAPLPAGASRP